MNLRKSILSTVFATTLAISGGSALAQDATPDADADATPVTYTSVNPQVVKNADGAFAGTVSLWEDADGVHLVLKGSAGEAVEPGEYVVHIHENGVCETDGENAFDTAGDHVNASDEDHGDEHGDDEVMTVEEDGSFEFWASYSDATLEPDAEGSLNDADGSSIVIHSGVDASEDDANRAACGVIFAPMSGDATPEATPAE